MEKTLSQIEETNNEVPQMPATQDETSVAVANLTSILEGPKSPGGGVSSLFSDFYIFCFFPFIFITFHIDFDFRTKKWASESI